MSLINYFDYIKSFLKYDEIIKIIMLNHMTLHRIPSLQYFHGFYTLSNEFWIQKFYIADIERLEHENYYINKYGYYDSEENYNSGSENNYPSQYDSCYESLSDDDFEDENNDFNIIDYVEPQGGRRGERSGNYASPHRG